jgi:hypothetical protein
MGNLTWWQWLLAGVCVVLLIKSPTLAAHKADQALGAIWFFLGQLAKFAVAL